MKELEYFPLFFVILHITIIATCVTSSAPKEQSVRVVENKSDGKVTPKCVESTLHKLVRDGNTTGLSMYVAEGGNIYEKDCQQRTALHIAILEGNKEMVENLLEVESNNTVDSTERGSVLLLAKDSKGSTPIMLAIEGDNTDISAILVDGGFDVMRRLDSDNSSLLHFAAVKGSAKSIRWLVERGLDVNDTDVDRHWVPLHHAAFHGHLQATKALLDLDSCISCKDKWGYAPIARAMERDSVDVGNALVEAGVDVHQRLQPNNITLLHFAASQGKPKYIQWLVEKGFNVNETDDFHHWTPLHHAIFHGKQQAAKTLINLDSCISCKDKWGFTPLKLAIQNDDIATASVLVASGADLNQRVGPDNTTLLHLAASVGGVDAIRWLVRKGLDVNETDEERHWIPLHHAIFHGKDAASKMLLKLKSCTSCKDKWGFTPLMRAVQNDDISIIKALIESGADINERLESNSINLLHFAAANGSVESIKLLVNEGLDVNSTDGVRQWIPLHHALFHGKLEAVKLLLQLKSCNSCKDKWSYTPLMRAVQRDDVSLMLALAESGADLSERLLSNKETLLHFAASSGSPDTIRWLVKRGLNVSSTDEGHQRIPLHYSAEHGKLQASKVLVSLGSCINCRDADGSTPLRLASHHNHQNVVEYLRSVDGKE